MTENEKNKMARLFSRYDDLVEDGKIKKQTFSAKENPEYYGKDGESSWTEDVLHFENRDVIIERNDERIIMATGEEITKSKRDIDSVMELTIEENRYDCNGGYLSFLDIYDSDDCVEYILDSESRFLKRCAREYFGLDEFEISYVHYYGCLIDKIGEYGVWDFKELEKGESEKADMLSLSVMDEMK